MQKICIFGLGYIGLPTACLFATHGYQVAGVDTDKQVVNEIDQGKTPFEESGLQELLQNALASNNLTVKTEPEAADVFLIAVPTPLDKETRIADLSHVREAAKGVVSYLKQGVWLFWSLRSLREHVKGYFFPYLRSQDSKKAQTFTWFTAQSGQYRGILFMKWHIMTESSAAGIETRLN